MSKGNGSFPRRVVVIAYVAYRRHGTVVFEGEEDVIVDLDTHIQGGERFIGSKEDVVREGGAVPDKPIMRTVVQDNEVREVVKMCYCGALVPASFDSCIYCENKFSVLVSVKGG